MANYSLLNFSNSKTNNLGKKQVYCEERKVFNNDYNFNENIITNENENILNPANFMSSNNNTRKLDVGILSENKIKLEDGISINIIKSHGDQRIKKFFHVPDFEIYVIKVKIQN